MKSMKNKSKFLAMLIILVSMNVPIGYAADWPWNWDWPWQEKWTPVKVNCQYQNTRSIIFFSETEVLDGEKKMCKEGGTQSCWEGFCKPIIPE